MDAAPLHTAQSAAEGELFGGNPSAVRSVGRQPAIEEAVDPAVEWRIVEGVHGEVHAALLDAGHCFRRSEAFSVQISFISRRHFGMELEAEGVGAAAEALHRIGVVGGQQLAAIGDVSCPRDATGRPSSAP